MRVIKAREMDKKYIFKVTALVKNYVAFTEKKGYHEIKTKEMPWRNLNQNI